MSKPFLNKREIETILSAYSKNFKYEFKKMGPYTYGNPIVYMLSLCPEVDRKGNKTGRILVNHYSYSHSKLRHIPEFIDVWEREDNELVFRTRNLPGKDLVSAEERIRVLEEELKTYRGLSTAEIAKLNTRKLRQESHKIMTRYEELGIEYNNVITRIHSYREEADSYFRECPAYWELISERDEAQLELSNLKEKNEELEKRLAKVMEQLLANSEKLVNEAEKAKPLGHNARGAGRKKDPVVALKREKALKLTKEGLTCKEICEKMGIGRTTYFRYMREVKEGQSK